MASIFNFCRSPIRPVVVVLGVAVCVSTAVGQKRLPGVIRDRNELRNTTVAAQTALLGRGQLTPAKKNALKKYYRHIIAGMTTPQGEANLPKLRSTLKTATNRAASAATHKYLTDLFFGGLRAIADPTKGYSAAARYNAILALGDLNSREERREGREITQRVVPYANAREFLHERMKDKPDAIHVACLLGLKRHATALAEDSKQQQDNRIGRIMLEILNRKEPPAGISEDGHLWMKRIAIETLGCMRNPAFVKVLLPIAQDETASLAMRCAAVEALGRLEYKKGQADPKLTATIGHLAVAACKSEVTRLTSEIEGDGVTGGRGRFVDGGARFGSSRDEVNPVVQRTRRQLIGDLRCVAISIKNIKERLPNDNMAEADALLKQVSKLANMLSKEAPDFGPEELLSRLEADTTTLETSVSH